MTFKTDDWTADDVTRPLPHAVGHEKSVLSTMLQDPQEFIPLAVEELLTERHFYLPSHAVLFSVLLDQFNAGKSVDLMDLVQTLLDTGRLDRVGGPSALTDIFTYAPSPGHFRQHVTKLREKFAGREIIRTCSEKIAAVYDSPEEIPATLEELERDVMAIRDMDAGEKAQTVKQAVAVVIDEFQAELRHDPKAKGLMTGYDELDRMTGGLKPGEMFVVGARPSVGKTSFMMNIAEHICVANGKPVLVFSAEMMTAAIVKRMTFSRAKFALSQLNRGHEPNKGDLQRIQRAALEIADAKLYIDDKTGPTINYIAAKARRMKREHDIQFIGIDYLQLLKSTSKQASNSREREIAEISAGIKGLAKDLGIPILILAQLNRDVDKRGAAKGAKAPRPRMSDLRESGAIEQDADLIGLLSRDGYQDGEDDTGVACVDLVKNRNGETGPIPLTFVADLMRFESGAPYRDGAEDRFQK